MGVFNRPDKQGNDIWYIRYRIGTKKKWERVGPDKHEAELLLVQRRKERESGRLQLIGVPAKQVKYKKLLNRSPSQGRKSLVGLVFADRYKHMLFSTDTGVLIHAGYNANTRRLTFKFRYPGGSILTLHLSQDEAREVYKRLKPSGETDFSTGIIGPDARVEFARKKAPR